MCESLRFSQSLTAEEYVTYCEVQPVLEDLLQRLAFETPTDPVRFMAEYFDSILRGEHVGGREYQYVQATTANRRAFIYACESAFAPFPDCEQTQRIGPEDFHELLCMLCPDFPYSVPQSCFSTLLGGTNGDVLVPFTTAMHAFFVEFYFQAYFSEIRPWFFGISRTRAGDSPHSTRSEEAKFDFLPDTARSSGRRRNRRGEASAPNTGDPDAASAAQSRRRDDEHDGNFLVRERSHRQAGTEGRDDNCGSRRGDRDDDNDDEGGQGAGSALDTLSITRLLEEHNRLFQNPSMRHQCVPPDIVRKVLNAKRSLDGGRGEDIEVSFPEFKRSLYGSSALINWLKQRPSAEWLRVATQIPLVPRATPVRGAGSSAESEFPVAEAPLSPRASRMSTKDKKARKSSRSARRSV